MILFSSTISSRRSFFATLLIYSFSTPILDCGIRTDVSVNLLPEWNGFPAIVDTAKLSGADVTNSSALSETLHCHAPLISSAVDRVVIRFLKVNEDFFPFSHPYMFQCGKESAIPSILGNMRPSSYYTWDTQAMKSQSPKPLSDTEIPLLPLWMESKFRWHQIPMPASMRLLVRLCDWQKLILPISAKRICSLGSIRSSSLRFYSVI